MKRILFLTIVLALVLSACAQSSSGTPTTQEPTGQASATLPPSEPTRQATLSMPPGEPMAGCTVTTRPTPNPTLEYLIPSPGEKDWKRGPSDAYVTIIEYGDYM